MVLARATSCKPLTRTPVMPLSCMVASTASLFRWMSAKRALAEGYRVLAFSKGFGKNKLSRAETCGSHSHHSSAILCRAHKALCTTRQVPGSAAQPAPAGVCMCLEGGAATPQGDVEVDDGWSG